MFGCLCWHEFPEFHLILQNLKRGQRKPLLHLHKNHISWNPSLSHGRRRPWGPVLQRPRPSQAARKPAQRRGSRRQPQSMVQVGARRKSKRLKTSRLRRKERYVSPLWWQSLLLCFPDPFVLGVVTEEWALDPMHARQASYFWAMLSFLGSFSPSWPGTSYVDQARLELTEICLSPPPNCWDRRCAPPHLCCF